MLSAGIMPELGRKKIDNKINKLSFPLGNVRARI
jgi:hypothetical protein